jgi:hypothetical protein
VQVVLLFSDQELRNDVFLDYLNTFLLSGEVQPAQHDPADRLCRHARTCQVPGLLTKDESELLLTEIIYELNQKQPLTTQATSEAPTLSKDFVMSFLRRRLQAHSVTSLHLLMWG